MRRFLRPLLRLLPAATALVVPVPEAQAVVSAATPPEECAVAHITLLWPFHRLPRRRDRAILRRIAGSQPSFEYRLDRIGTFPDVVFLHPDPSDPFREITNAIVMQWPHRQPYDGAFAEVVPHLTLRNGGSVADAQMRAIKERLPILATAREIHLVRPGARRWRVLYRASLAPETSE